MTDNETTTILSELAEQTRVLRQIRRHVEWLLVIVAVIGVVVVIVGIRLQSG